MYTGSGLELFAIAVVCKEVCISNSCPIFTLAAEQVVIHCINHCAPTQNLFLSAHREQIDPIHSPCTLLTASKCKTCTLLTASRYTLLQRSTTTLYFAHREQVQALLGSSQHTAASCEEAHRVLTHQSSGELSVSAKRWQSHDSNAEPVRTTRVIAALWPASYSIRAATIV